jgi:hypothetical protein
MDLMIGTAKQAIAKAQQSAKFAGRCPAPRSLTLLVVGPTLGDVKKPLPG